MPHWVCCNRCFLGPAADRQLALTSCGHVVCSVCYRTGKPGTCLICSSQCLVSALSEKSSPEVKALFSDISVVADKHFMEISKVIKFQARQQKRVLSYYQQKSEKLEDVLVKMRQEMQQMTKKLNEQSTYIVTLEDSLQQQRVQEASSVAQMSFVPPQSPHGHKAVLQLPYNSPVSLSRRSSISNMSENMEVEQRVLFRRPNSVPRLSLISPPQDGRVGSSRSPIQNHMAARHSVCSATVSRFRGVSLTPSESYCQTSGWKSPMLKPLSSFRHSMSSLARPPP